MRAALFLCLTIFASGCAFPAPAAEDAVLHPPWPALEDAPLRPGAQLGWAAPGVVGVYELRDTLANCTTNFLFRSLDNASLYFGTSAHCFHGEQVGDVVVFEKGLATGTLAYSSYLVLEALGISDDDRAWSQKRFRVGSH